MASGVKATGKVGVTTTASDSVPAGVIDDAGRTGS